MVPPKFVVLYCCVVSDIPVRVQIDHNGGLAGQFFLLVEGQRFPDEVPETAVVAGHMTVSL